MVWKYLLEANLETGNNTVLSSRNSFFFHLIELMINIVYAELTAMIVRANYW